MADVPMFSDWPNPDRPYDNVYEQWSILFNKAERSLLIRFGTQAPLVLSESLMACCHAILAKAHTPDGKD